MRGPFSLYDLHPLVLFKAYVWLRVAPSFISKELRNLISLIFPICSLQVS